MLPSVRAPRVKTIFVLCIRSGLLCPGPLSEPSLAGLGSLWSGGLPGSFR